MTESIGKDLLFARVDAMMELLERLEAGLYPVTEDTIQKRLEPKDGWFLAVVQQDIPDPSPGRARKLKAGREVWVQRASASKWYVGTHGDPVLKQLDRAQARRHLSTVLRPVMAPKMVASAFGLASVLKTESLEEERIMNIRRRTGPKTKRRAEGYEPKISGRLRGKNRNVWIFETGDWIQRLRAIPTSDRQQRVETMDVKVTCNCPAFRWGGSEHWAKANGYLYGNPRGTATFPEEKDPDMRNGACKHLIAVFDLIREKKLKIDAPKTRMKR